MKQTLGLALFAAILIGGPSAALADSFGLFTCGGCKGFCSPCPRPYNAFSAFPCCAIGNAAGTTCFPPAGVDYSGYVAQFGPGPGHWGGKPWYGFQKHWGHAYGFPYDLPLPYPCGALAAFTGTPGMGGCGDPFNGCGSKKVCLWYPGCNLPGSSSVPHPGILGKLKNHHGHGCHGGNCGYGVGINEVVISGDVPWGGTTNTPAVPAAPAAPTPPAVLPAPTPGSVHQPVSYQPAYYPAYQPAYYPAYYGGYYPAWGYYPMYGN